MTGQQAIIKSGVAKMSFVDKVRPLVEIWNVWDPTPFKPITMSLTRNAIVNTWNETGILKDIMQHKLVFFKTQDYRRACDCDRGAVFFSVARYHLRGMSCLVSLR